MTVYPMKKYALLGAGVVLAVLGAYLFLKGLVNFNRKTSMSEKNDANGMVVKSSAFSEGDSIPAKYTCDGENVNPLLEIKGAPREAKSLVLIVDDPDATNGKTWNHWLVWNIDPHTQYLSEDSIPQGGVQGTTSFGSVRYGGPCPPRGDRAHRYQFKLYALDTELGLPEGALKEDVLAAMEGHIIAETMLTGTYKRKN